MSSFVHLHLHSHFSLLDGANRIGDVLDTVGELGMPAVALTDHGNLFGAIDFYRRATRAGIKPILGIEAYSTVGSRHERDPRQTRNHLVLLARNATGFQNLIKLTSRAFLEGFYYKPRIDRELLAEYGEGLIGLSACLKGEVNERILNRQESEAETSACEYRDLLGPENFYLELQNHGLDAQLEANVALRRISKRTGIPLVATNDCHYLRQEDSLAHDVLLCIGTQKTLSDPDRLRYATDQFYLKSAEQMYALFPDDGAAVENSLRIAERCDIQLPEDEFHLPEFPIPAGHSLDSYFDEVVSAGLSERLDELRRRGSRSLSRRGQEAYQRRLEHEVGVIRQMGFVGYFLIVWDFIRYARENAIPVGPGRGSAAGSLVAYALRITDIDPLEYDLLFERFLNPERVSLPDIDIDFCMRRRGEVIQYVNEKYGRDRVAQIITFGTLAARGVLRDVGRVMGLPYSKVDRIAKLVPEMTSSLSELTKEGGPLSEAVGEDPEVAKVVEVGTRLEGLSRHASLHAAGVVIAPRPIDELVPLAKTSKDEIVTQWDKDVIESLGLLKMDFLGLRTLTVIEDTLRVLEQQGGPLDLDEIPLDDADTYRLYCEGRTNGIFQFESAGMKDLLRSSQPSRFEDLAALCALYRPGALSVGMVEQYVKRKQGKRKIRYPLPETEPILAETYGVIVYQEQVMQIAVEVAGFSLADADLLRKAMGKKDARVMAEQKEKFISGAAERGVAKAKARSLWEQIEPFAGYGFNKSHSVAYAMVAYKTAYLKAHHPVAFLAAMLTSEMASKDNVAKYFRETREMGLEVLPPDVNESGWIFTTHRNAIRFGLGAIKGVGEGTVEAILEARARVGRFRSLAHFATEVDSHALNQKVLECLIKAGSFDSLGFERSALHSAAAETLGFAGRRQREEEAGQGSLFSASSLPEPGVDESVPPWDDRERLRYEKETLGLYLTGNPLAEHREQLDKLATHRILVLREGYEGPVKVGGLVTGVKRARIKSGPNAGRIMGRFRLEDEESSVPVAVFADQLQRYGHLLEDEAVVVVQGTCRLRAADVELTVEKITALAEAGASLVEGVEISLDPALPPGKLLELRDLLIEHAGEVPVHLRVPVNGKTVQIDPEARYKVDLRPELVAAIESIAGPNTVRAVK